jgi:hypothetical protein
MSGDATSLVNIAAAFMTLFAIALRNSWRFVISVQRKAE